MIVRGESCHTGFQSELTLAGPSADIWDEATAAGLGLGRARLTGVAPGSPHGGTAQGLGAHNPRQLALAHLLVHLCETRACPVIWREKSKFHCIMQGAVLVAREGIAF